MNYLMKTMNEKKYTKIPNEILEALARTKLSNYEFRYVWVLLRKTLGWNKSSDYISPSQFVKATNVRKWHVWRTEKKLLWRKIVTKRGNKLSFNSNYGEWRMLPIGAIVTKSGIRVANQGNKVTNRGGHKEHSPNNTKQRKDGSFSSNKERIEAYKQGKRWEERPFCWDEEMRWMERGGQWRWEVLPKEGGSWLEFGGKEEDIEWKKY